MTSLRSLHATLLHLLDLNHERVTWRHDAPDLRVTDVFGSDAMNPDPDYSTAYLTLHSDAEGLEGNGLTFTIGRGNELYVAAIQTLAP